MEEFSYAGLKEIFSKIKQGLVLDASGNPVSKDDVAYYVRLGYLMYIFSKSRVVLGLKVYIRFYRPKFIMSESEFEFYKKCQKDVLEHMIGNGDISKYRYDDVFRLVKAEMFINYLCEQGFFQICGNDKLKDKITSHMDIKIEPLKFQGLVEVAYFGYIMAMFLDALKLSQKGKVLISSKVYIDTLRKYFDFPEVSVMKKSYSKDKGFMKHNLMSDKPKKSRGDLCRIFIKVNTGWFKVFNDFASVQDYIYLNSELFNSLVKFFNADNLLFNDSFKKKKYYLYSDDLKLNIGENDG